MDGLWGSSGGDHATLDVVVAQPKSKRRGDFKFAGSGCLASGGEANVVGVWADGFGVDDAGGAFRWLE